MQVPRKDAAMIELGAALLGAIIDGAMTIAGSWWQAEQQRRAMVRSLQVALAAEISTIVTFARSNAYAEDLLKAVQQIRGPDYRAEFTAFHVNTGHSYFSVYEGNAGQIGELPNDLSTQVVAFYKRLDLGWTRCRKPMRQGRIYLLGKKPQSA